MGRNKPTWLARVLVTYPPSVKVPSVFAVERRWKVADENFRYFQLANTLLNEFLTLEVSRELS